MTAEQLRNSILQEAISGRLVPQDPNDEPASALLARIREEKARLVKEGKLKKKDLVETPITDEEKPFEIPSSWAWVRWGNLAFSIMYGYNAPAEDNGDIRMVRISDIQDNKVLWDKVPFCKIKPSDIETYLLKPNDILFARTGGTVGKSYIVNDVPYPSIYAGYLIRTQYSEQLCLNYLKYFMESRLYWSQLRDETIATAQPNCNGKKLAAMMLPLPPLAEQKRIVAKLEELLPIVEQYGKAQKELDELNAALPTRLRQSILQEAISGRLVPQDSNDEPTTALLQRIREERECLFKVGKIKKKDYHIYDMSDEEIPFELPQGWAWEKLGNLTEIISDGTHKTPHYVESGIPFLSVQNISGGQLDLSKIKYITQVEHEELIKRVKPQKGDLLICRIGTLGKAIKIYWDFEFSIFVSLGLIRLVDSSLADYISLIINSPIGNSWIQENKVGGGTHTFKINLGDIPNMMLPLPPLPEQQRIVAKIEELFEQIDKITK